MSREPPPPRERRGSWRGGEGPDVGIRLRTLGVSDAAELVRIGILTQYYPPEMGAPQARLSDLAKRFVDRGHEVVVLTAMPSYPTGRVFSGYGGFFRKEVRDGVTVIRTGIFPTRSVATLPRLLNYFSFVFSSLLAGIVCLGRLDYLVTESPPLFLGISGYCLSAASRARWIFNVSDLWPESAVRLGVVTEGWSLRLARALERFCYRKAWLVTGQSREILSNIEQRFPGVRTYHLSNGVDTELFQPERASQSTRTELLNGASSSKESCIALYAGLHGIAQGLEQVLDAAARLQDVAELFIVFAGDGPTKEALVRRRDELGLPRVRFLSARPREAMPALIASADMALVPLKISLPGAVPSKVYEAMGAGVPVVLVASGEAADLVRAADAGIVVAPGDIDGLADALRRLTCDPELRRRFGAAGRQAARDRFDRNQIAQSFIGRLEASHSC